MRTDETERQITCQRCGVEVFTFHSTYSMPVTADGIDLGPTCQDCLIKYLHEDGEGPAVTP